MNSPHLTSPGEPHPVSEPDHKPREKINWLAELRGLALMLLGGGKRRRALRRDAGIPAGASTFRWGAALLSLVAVAWTATSPSPWSPMTTS